jgi:hypothetical protein
MVALSPVLALPVNRLHIADLTNRRLSQQMACEEKVGCYRINTFTHRAVNSFHSTSRPTQCEVTIGSVNALHPSSSQRYLAQMNSVPDLVRQSKREAQFSPDCQYTQHFYYVSKPGCRLTKEVEKWKRKKALGSGSFGAVYLEECIQGNEQGKVRAVKEMRKLPDNEYYRELEAIALFSSPQVSILACFCRRKQLSI